MPDSTNGMNQSRCEYSILFNRMGICFPRLGCRIRLIEIVGKSAATDDATADLAEQPSSIFFFDEQRGKYLIGGKWANPLVV